MTVPVEPGTADLGAAQRRSGILMLVCAAVSVLAMAHHPSIGAHAAAADLPAAIGRFAHLSALVHGVLIAVIWLLTIALTAVVDCTGGWQRLSQRAAFIAWCLGAALMTGAALISGFLISRIAAGVDPADAVGLAAFQATLQLGHAGNQVLAQAAVWAMSVAIGLWSLGVWRAGGLLRAVAVLGLVAALLPVSGLVIGHLRLDVHGMGAVVLLQMLWIAAVGALLARGRLRATLPGNGHREP